MFFFHKKIRHRIAVSLKIKEKMPDAGSLRICIGFNLCYRYIKRV